MTLPALISNFWPLPAAVSIFMGHGSLSRGVSRMATLSAPRARKQAVGYIFLQRLVRERTGCRGPPDSRQARERSTSGSALTPDVRACPRVRLPSLPPEL